MNSITLQQASQNPSVVLSRIGMLLNARVSCLIVEGPDDLKFYAQFTISDHCQIFEVGGREAVAKYILSLEERHVTGMLGIVDADFIRLEKKGTLSPNILETDTHDLETMLFRSPALEKILLHFGFVNSKDVCIGQAGKDLRELLLFSGKVIAYLRWSSYRHNLNLTFNNLNFDEFIDKNTLSIDTSKLIYSVKKRSQNQSLQESDIIDMMSKLEDNSHDPYELCCGHDLANLLGHGLRETMKQRGIGKNKLPSNDAIEGALRLAYEFAYFANTRLHSSILTWENQNSLYN